MQVDKLQIGNSAANFGEHEGEARLVRVWRLLQIDQGHWGGATVDDLKFEDFEIESLKFQTLGFTKKKYFSILSFSKLDNSKLNLTYHVSHRGRGSGHAVLLAELFLGDVVVRAVAVTEEWRSTVGIVEVEVDKVTLAAVEDWDVVDFFSGVNM